MKGGREGGVAGRVPGLAQQGRVHKPAQHSGQEEEMETGGGLCLRRCPWPAPAAQACCTMAGACRPSPAMPAAATAPLTAPLPAVPLRPRPACPSSP